MKQKLVSLLALLLALSMLWSCGSFTSDDDSDDKGGALGVFDKLIPDGNSDNDEEDENDDRPASTTAPPSRVEPLPTEAVTPSLGNEYTFSHTTLTLPAGFTVTDVSGSKVAVYETYPNPSDNIAFATTPNPGSIDLYTEATLTEAYTQSFGGDFQFLSYEKDTVDGVPALLCAYSMTINNTEMVGIQVLIFGGNFMDIVTFTLVSGQFTEAFQACAESIRVN